MSRSRDGRLLYCNGAGCTAVTTAPVALQPVRRPNGHTPAARWLFLLEDGVWKHYCPECALRLSTTPLGQDSEPELVPH